MSFRELSTFARIAPHRYAGAFTEAWYQGRGAFGGLVTASLLRALIDEAGDGRTPRTLTVHFCAPAPAGPLEIETRTERAGNYVTHLSARLLSRGELCATALATFARDRGEPFRLEPAPMPAAPPPEAVTPLPWMELMPAFARFVEYRYCLGAPMFSDAPEARLGGWCRLMEPVEADAPMIAALLDAWPPAYFTAIDGLRASASVDMTCQFLQPLPLTDAGLEDFYLFEHHMPSLANGFAEELGALWRRDGTLLARIRQLVTIF